MKILFSELPKFPWWGSGTPAYENNWAMQIGKIPNQNLVSKEHQGVFQALTKYTDLEVIPFDPELDANVLNKHDAVFLRDSFVSNQKGSMIISHYAEKERQIETKHLESYLEKNGFKLQYLSEHAFAEGGEFHYCQQDTILLAGISRNNKKGIEEVADFLNVSDVCIVASDSFHLDTICTSVLGANGRLVGIIVSLPLVKNSDEVKRFAKKHTIELIDIHPHDAIDFDGSGIIAVNTLPIPGKLIGGGKFTTPGAEEKLQAMGIEHVVAPITQFLLSGGGVHCLTNELLF